MKTSEVQDTLTRIFKQDTRFCSVFLRGAPGIGKGALVSAAAKAAHKTLMTLALPTCDEVDLRGMPYVAEGKTLWASPLPHKGHGVLLLDEIASASPAVQVASHHIVWDETGSDMTLAPGWHVIMTGNRAKDRTLYRAMSGPLRNRVTVIDVETDIESWSKWAIDERLDSAIIGFLRWRPNLLVTENVPDDGAFPSPRSWHKASMLLSQNFDIRVEREMLTGTIGNGAETEFSAYLRTLRDLPKIQTIMDNQEKADIPSSPSLLYALVTSLAKYTNINQKSAMKYVGRLPAEFGVLYIRDIRDNFELKTDPDVRKWIGDHKRLFQDDIL